MLVLALAVSLAMGACSRPAAGGENVQDIQQGWRAVTSAETPAAEAEAMNNFWRVHVRDAGASLQVKLRDRESGEPVPIARFDPDRAQAYRVQVRLEDEALEFTPQSAESVYVLLRE